MLLPNRTSADLPSREESREIKDATPLACLLREGVPMALAFAEYGVPVVCGALFRAAHDTAANNERLHVTACAPDTYSAQEGDVASLTNGFGYRIMGQPDKNGLPPLEASHLPGERRVHVLTARVPVQIIPMLENREHDRAVQRLDAGGIIAWGSLEGGHQQPEYVVRRAYLTHSPDPQAVHALIMAEHSRVLTLLRRTATHPRTSGQFRPHGLTLNSDALSMTGAVFRP